MKRAWFYLFFPSVLFKFTKRTGVGVAYKGV